MIEYFIDQPEIACCFSTREDGNLSFKYPEIKPIVENRQKMLDLFNLNLENVVAVSQPHGNQICHVTANNQGEGARANEKGLILAIETADCLPIFAFDPKMKVIAAVHAGWRGVVANIAGNLVQNMIDRFHCSVENIRIVIGPHIQEDHFEIKNDIIGQFDSHKHLIVKQQEKIYIPLAQIVIEQLRATGIEDKNVEKSDLCTVCDERFFSYRREGKDCPGSMLGIICLL